MKEVAIIYTDTRNGNAIDYIEGSLKDIFADHIRLKRYFLNQLDKGCLISADAVLLNGEKLLYTAQPYLSRTDNIVVLNRSIIKNNLDKLMAIPKDADMLVVNDTPKTTLDLLYMLYGLGIHFNLIPFDESKKASDAYNKIRYAVTPGERQIVPDFIENVIDIGYRKIDFDALLKIMNLLELDGNEEINNNLIKYLYTVTQPNMNSHTNYLESYIKNLILNQLMSDSGFSILAFDSHGKLIFQNDNAIRTFPGGVFPDPDERCFPDPQGKDCRNQLVTIDGTNYLMDRMSIDSANRRLGCIISLRNEQNIRESETFLTKKLKEKNTYAKYQFHNIVSHTRAMNQCIDTAKQAALTDYTILLYGESGTGKEMFAQSIHNYSHRKNKPFLAINCSSLSESLLESELFGYEAGSFTGAHKNGKAGLFEQANTGTIFLDEIGDISPSMQTRLLRVLQEKQIMRIGGDKIIDVDVRIITATNRDLREMVQQRQFRRDLFYRLCVIPIEIPPLRERREDILSLFRLFAGPDYDRLMSEQLKLLQDHDWPGNVRELENVAIYFKALHSFPSFTFSRQKAADNSDSPEHLSGADMVSEMILRFLAEKAVTGAGAGRPDILNMLHSEGLLLGDGKLRKAIQDLKEKGLITVEKGRSGTKITSKGLDYIDNKQHPRS